MVPAGADYNDAGTATRGGGDTKRAADEDKRGNRRVADEDERDAERVPDENERGARTDEEGANEVESVAVEDAEPGAGCPAAGGGDDNGSWPRMLAGATPSPGDG